MQISSRTVLLVGFLLFLVVSLSYSASLNAVKKNIEKDTNSNEVKASSEVSKDEGDIEKLEDSAANNDEEELSDDLNGSDDVHEENEADEKDDSKEQPYSDNDEGNEPSDIKDVKVEDSSQHSDLMKGIADAKTANSDLQTQIDLLNKKLQDFVNGKADSSEAKGESPKADGAKDKAKAEHDVEHKPSGKEPDMVSQDTKPNGDNKHHNSRDESEKQSKDSDNDLELADDIKDDISDQEVEKKDLKSAEKSSDEEKKEYKGVKSDEEIKVIGEAKKDEDVKKTEEKKDVEKKDDKKTRKDESTKEDVTVLGPGVDSQHIRKDETGEDEDSLPDDDY